MTCKHPGCANHVTHPCEGCGRITGAELKQIIYEHGGSRIYLENPYTRELLADTYGNVKIAEVVRKALEEWLEVYK